MNRGLTGTLVVWLVGCGGNQASQQQSDAGQDVSGSLDVNPQPDGGPQTDVAGQQDAQPDAGVDAPVDGPVDVPVVTPTITGLSPSWLSVGQPDLNFTLLVNGRDLPEQAWIIFDGYNFTAQFVSTTQLQVSTPTIALGTRPRLVPVMVEPKGPPDLPSNTLFFEVTAADAGPGN